VQVYFYLNSDKFTLSFSGSLTPALLKPLNVEKLRIAQSQFNIDVGGAVIISPSSKINDPLAEAYTLSA
jgi:hypothetical protein